VYEELPGNDDFKDVAYIMPWDLNVAANNDCSSPIRMTGIAIPANNMPSSLRTQNFDKVSLK